MHDEIASHLAGSSGAVLVVTSPADLNHVTADKLRACVDARLPAHDDAGVVLEASSLSLITSVGVAALLQVLDICRSRGASFCIAGLTGEALHFLEMLRLEDKFERRDDLDDAIAFVEGRLS
ncbi:MAG: STAS domain-containing protein [Planctomycetota bacterium]